MNSYKMFQYSFTIGVPISLPTYDYGVSRCAWPQVFLYHQTEKVPLHWGAADAEIKVPSRENTELKRSPFKAWSRSVCSHTCYAYCQGFLPCLFLPFRSFHLHFFQNISRFLLTHGSCVGPQNKLGHPAGCRFPC